MELLSVDLLKDFLQDHCVNKDLLLVDVRSPDECRSGMIPGSRNIPVDNLLNTPDIFNGFLKIVFICHSGIRSQRACALVSECVNASCVLYSLQGGIVAWRAHNLQTAINGV